MGHKHSRDEILDGAVAVAFEHGLNQLSFGRVAKHLGIADRTVVYYFPSKDDLASNVLVAVGASLQRVLETALPARVSTPAELASAGWRVLASPDAAPTFALYFEAVGLAAAGQEPYRSLTAVLTEAWIDWLARCFAGSAQQRRRRAEAALALIDGLLLVRQLAGADAAERAARELGVTGRSRSSAAT